MSVGTAANTRVRIAAAAPLSPIAVFESTPYGRSPRYDAVFFSTVAGRRRVERDPLLVGVFHGAGGVRAFDKIHKAKRWAQSDASLSNDGGEE